MVWDDLKKTTVISLEFKADFYFSVLDTATILHNMSKRDFIYYENNDIFNFLIDIKDINKLNKTQKLSIAWVCN